MKRETYEKTAETVRRSPALMKGIIWSDRILTKISYIVYPVLILLLIIRKDPDVVRAVAVPAVSFVVVSVFRYVYCAPRPYEVFGITPVIKKETKGKSFPSRHVFSAFIIAFTVFYFLPPLGIMLFVLSGIMAAVRVLGGVHFVKDVAAGAVIGICCGIIGFYLI